jgi:hypothetical protein
MTLQKMVLRFLSIKSTSSIFVSTSYYVQSPTMADNPILEPWVVDSFSIEAGVDGIHDDIFANGQMQIPITITLDAHQHNTETGDDVRYTLSQEEWSSLELELKDGRPLPSGWKISSDENEFDHQVPSMHGKERPDIPPRHRPDNKHNTAVRWLTTTKAEVQHIRASIIQGNGERVTTLEGGSFSTVTITGINAIVYTPGILVLETNTETGCWTLPLPGADGKEMKWHATNYYVYPPPPYHLKTAEVIWEEEEPESRRIFEVAGEHDGLYTVVAAGWCPNDGADGHVEYRFENNTLPYDLVADLRVNERAGVPCFTHVKFESTPLTQSYSSHPGDVWFQFWDNYGNHGKFYPRVTGDRSGIEFQAKS